LSFTQKVYLPKMGIFYGDNTWQSAAQCLSQKSDFTHVTAEALVLS